MSEVTQLPGRLFLNQMVGMFRRVSSPKFTADNTRHSVASASPLNRDDIKALAGEAELFQVAGKDAQPFLLPPNGDLGLEGKRSVMVGELRPPYPATALEFTFDNEWSSTHNFAAMVIFILDDWQLANEFSMSIMAAFLDRSGNWGWCDEWVRIPPGITLEVAGFDACEFSGPVYRGSLGLAEGHPEYRPLWAFITRIAADFLCLLSCSNVDIADATISRLKLERDRDKHRGRFLIYKVLDLHNRTAAESEGETTGAHASPRFHYRRGHIRRLQTGRNVWVRMCAVGNTANGLVAKDYRVRDTVSAEVSHE